VTLYKEKEKNITTWRKRSNTINRESGGKGGPRHYTGPAGGGRRSKKRGPVLFAERYFLFREGRLIPRRRERSRSLKKKGECFLFVRLPFISGIKRTMSPRKRGGGGERGRTSCDP